MSVKEIKEEIKEEESFLLRLFQLEKIIKKYKNLLIGIGVLIVVGFFGYQINNYLQTQQLIKTNEAYNKLLTNPNEKDSLHNLNVLKENQKLFRLYLLQTANTDIKKLQQVANGNDIVANIAKYQLAVLNDDKKQIETYSLSIGAIYKDLALLNVERICLQNNNYKKAKEIASQIKDNTISKLANNLLHYGIIK